MCNIAIIPARGGSKRIPRKNIKGFLGRPIIAYSIDVALESQLFDMVMVSTDDNEIAAIAKKYGAEVPFYRSQHMSLDTTPTAPVLTEVLGELEKQGRAFDYVCCLYPCAPFVTSVRLKEAMNLLITSEADSVFPVVKFSHPPQRCLVMRGKRIEMLHPENRNTRSQDLESQYHDAGQFYCIKTSSLFKYESILCENTIPLILPDVEVQDIDTEQDWISAEIKYQIIQRLAK